MTFIELHTMITEMKLKSGDRITITLTTQDGSEADVFNITAPKQVVNGFSVGDNIVIRAEKE